MEKSDLKSVLKEDKSEEKGKEVMIRKHKKPIQLRDIENRSSGTNRLSSKTDSHDNIKDLINKEKNEIFKQPWNKLDNGMKLNRIRLFTESEAKEKELTKVKQEDLRKLLVDAICNNKLNKNTEVEYDIEEKKIISIKQLIYKNGKYSLPITETKKIKKTTKSKSNIDRFIGKKN